MDEKIQKKINTLYGVIITMGTIIVGLISYIFYTENIPLFREPKRCEYNGWAYAHKEIYQSVDGCNTCFCSNGDTICTEMACSVDTSLEP